MKQKISRSFFRPRNHIHRANIDHIELIGQQGGLVYWSKGRNRNTRISDWYHESI